MYELRLIYTRGPKGEERVAFTTDLEAPADDWCLWNWTVELDTLVCLTSMDGWPSSFPSDNEFEKVS